MMVSVFLSCSQRLFRACHSWFHLTSLIAMVLLMGKWMGLFLRKKSSFKMMRLTFSSKLDWCSCIISIAKTASKKIGALIRSIKFLFPEVALYLYKYAHVWNTVVTSALAPLVATWKCQTNYKNEYAGLLVHHLLLLLNLCLVVKIQSA